MKAHRVCAQCGKVEPKRLWLHPGRMFKIWKGASHDVDLCSFECSKLWYAAERDARLAARPAPEPAAPTEGEAP